MDGIGTPEELPSGIGTRVVVIWLALLRVGAPPGEWVPRSIWKNAVRATTGVGSRQGLQDYLLTAEDFGLLEVQRGAGGRQGLVKLAPADSPHVFTPGVASDVVTSVAATDVPPARA